jgi:predicted dehydrogenase
MHHFLEGIASGKQGEPGFFEAFSVARVQQAIQRSWKTGHWEDIET